MKSMTYKFLIRLSVIKKRKGSEGTGGIGQVQMVKFCSGKLLSQLVIKPSTTQTPTGSPNDHTSKSYTIYDIT